MEIFSKIGTASADFLDAVFQLFKRTHQRFEKLAKKRGVVAFFNHVNELLSFHRAISELTFEDEQISTALDYLHRCDVNDRTMFPVFASFLYSLHISPDLNNRIEAAETLVMGAHNFTWNDRDLIAAGFDLPKQTRGERKFAMLMKAASLFMETQFYERAIEVLQDLRNSIPVVSGDYMKLRMITQRESECYDNMVIKDRPLLNRFYGVQFFGRFSKFYPDGSLFVYRRGGFFMATQMIQELTARFPGATVDFVAPSPEELANPDIRYILVFNLKPRERKTKFDPLELPANVMYRSVCGIDEFFSETAVRIRRTDGKFNEMAEWYRRIVTYRTAHKLQGLARRLPLVQYGEPKLMLPVECAISDTNDKTIELMRCASLIWRNLRFGVTVELQSISALSLLLQGVVVAAVNGGTQIFIDLFLRGPLKDDPSVKPFAEALKDALRDQMKAIRFGLDIHAVVMKEPERALHETWESNFEDARVKAADILQVIDFAEPPVFGEIPLIRFHTGPKEEQ
jgi:hypothetical protein